MLVGSVVMSIWGGPQKRVYAIFGFIGLGAVGIFVMGLNASLAFPAIGLALLMFAIPLASGPSQAIFQSKVDPGVQGRVFAIRGMISGSMLPLATLISGPLADRVFEPLMQPGAALANSWVGSLVGIGAGRGVGLMFISAGVLLFIATIIAYSIPTIRLVESSLPDVLPDPIETKPEPQAVSPAPAEAGP